MYTSDVAVDAESMLLSFVLFYFYVTVLTV